MNTQNFNTELNELLIKIGHKFDNEEHKEEVKRIVDILKLYNQTFIVFKIAPAFLFEVHLKVLYYFKQNAKKYNLDDFDAFVNACQNAYFNQCIYELMKPINERDVKVYDQKNFDGKKSDEIFEYAKFL
jgi:hypothetical protein